MPSLASEEAHIRTLRDSPRRRTTAEKLAAAGQPEVAEKRPDTRHATKGQVTVSSKSSDWTEGGGGGEGMWEWDETFRVQR
jgi:hypothetical protein